MIQTTKLLLPGDKTGLFSDEFQKPKKVANVEGITVHENNDFVL